MCGRYISKGPHLGVSVARTAGYMAAEILFRSKFHQKRIMTVKKIIEMEPPSEPERPRDPVSLSVAHDRLVCQLHWKVIAGLMVFIGLFCAILVLLLNMNTMSSTCFKDLENVKQQLEVETIYKDHVENLLTSAQKYHDADKDRFKYLMQSCYAITQQNVFWKFQADDTLQDASTTQETH